MSLKAKIEAVIYASEEPVTLAQLAGLLGEEAQAELDSLASRQQSLPLNDQPASGLQASQTDAEVLNAEPAKTEAEGTEGSNPEDQPSADPEPPATNGFSRDGDTENESALEKPAVEQASGAVADAKAIAAAAKQKERLLREYFRSLLDQLIADYASDARGLEIREVAGGFRLATKPEYHDAVRGFVKSLKPPLKLSLQALETLAVVAYKQPVTAPEVSEIRGVDSAGVLGSLMTRKLVTTAGRKQVIGRPILYKTTRDFLLRFGLKDINELPSIEEFEKMAGELNAVIQEEIPMEASPSAIQDDGGRTAAHSEQETTGGASASLDELNSAPEPTHIHHDTVEDLMSDRSSSPEGHNREHTDPTEVEPQSQPEHESQLRAEEGDSSENIADGLVIDGRISGPPPNYADDNPSAQEAKEQQDEQDQAS